MTDKDTEPSDEESWRRYEKVAASILSNFRQVFELDRIEPKQRIQGSSGTEWEIDAKGIPTGENAGIVVIECKHWPSRRVSQATVAGLAYTIQDVGGDRGIIVSPLPLQTGAQLVGQHANLIHVQLAPDCTPEDFAFKVLDRLFIGMGDRIRVSDTVKVEIRRHDTKNTSCRPDETPL